jgi:hypothetical protein
MKPPARIALLSAALLALSLVSPLLFPQIRDSALAARQSADAKGSGPAGQIPEALPKGKKLMLKDGTYQLAREYSVEGDRVRYWSVERSQWEEIPAGLVDWDATRKSEADDAARDADLKAKIHASNIARLTKDIDVDKSLEIKPGLFLPDEIGLYALDRDKQIRAMKQNTADVKISTGREIERIMTGVPLINSKKVMDMPGARAALRLRTAEPEFFFRPADAREPRFRLFRAQVKNGHRVLDNIIVHFTGQETDKANEIEMQTWTPASGVFRYTMDERLEPGEYAFVEMTDQGISGYVWDFGIDAPSSKPQK